MMSKPALDHKPFFSNKKKYGAYWMPTSWFPVYIAFCPNENSWGQIMRAFKVDGEQYPWKSSARTTSFEKGEEVSIIVTIRRRNLSTNRLHALIVHEAMHVFQIMCDAIGEGSPSREFEAYSVQAICRFLFAAFGESRGKN